MPKSGILKARPSRIQLAWFERETGASLVEIQRQGRELILVLQSFSIPCDVRSELGYQASWNRLDASVKQAPRWLLKIHRLVQFDATQNGV